MSGKMLVGWGEADITPKGGAISLIGQWEERVTDAVLDTICAVAMAMRSGEERVILVACDLCGITKPLSDEVKMLLRASVPEFQDHELILSATHIHTGPGTEERSFLTLLDGRADPQGAIPTGECRRQIALAIEAAVLQALGSMRESRFEYAVSHIITGVNRRATYADGSSEMYGDIHRPDFRGMEGRDGGPMQFLFARNEADGAISGVVAAVPCTAQCDEMGLYVTADYWGHARKTVRDELGQGVGILGLIRSAGDLSPHAMIDGGKSLSDMRGADAAKQMGERIGGALLRAMHEASCAIPSDAPLRHLWANEEMPVWTPTTEQYQWGKAYLEEHEAELGALTDMMDFSSAAAYVKRYESAKERYTVNLHALRIGDVALITNPFELFIEYADRIRAACPDANVIDVQLAGDENLGYLATQRAIDGGGYSAMIFSGVLNAEGGEAVVGSSIRMIRQIMEG